MTQLSPHFTLAELTRSQTAARRGIANIPDDVTVPRLQRWCLNVAEPVRAHFGRPVFINSGFRCAALNRAIGGSGTSQHCLGEAGDFEVPGIPNIEVARFIAQGGLPAGFDQLILEAYTPGRPSSGWVHCSWSTRRLRRQVLTMQVRGGRSTYLQGLVA